MPPDEPAVCPVCGGAMYAVQVEGNVYALPCFHWLYAACEEKNHACDAPETHPDREPTRQAPQMRGHLDSDGHKTPGSTLVTFLVITLGMALALILAALHLGEAP